MIPLFAVAVTVVARIQPWAAVGSAAAFACCFALWSIVRTRQPAPYTSILNETQSSDQCQAEIEALGRVRAMSSALAAIGPQTQLEDVRAAVVSTVCSALGCDTVALLSIDQFMGGVECEISSGSPDTLRAPMIELFAHTLTDIERTEAWVYEDITAPDSDCSPQFRQIADEGIAGIVAAPISSDTGVRGTLVVLYREPIAQPRLRGALIEAAASLTASSLAHALATEQSSYLVEDLFGANQELAAQATVDGLTGLVNHRSMQQRLSDLCGGSSARKRRVFSLIMADVDHFKSFNDTYGHQEGDAVLRQVAGAISSQVRQNDVAARYGGEEFAVLLPGTGKEVATAVAERIRLAVSAERFHSGTVTISLGVAEYPSDGTKPSEIIEKADQALYQAKMTGRNRVVVWGSIQPEANADRGESGQEAA